MRDERRTPELQPCPFCGVAPMSFLGGDGYYSVMCDNSQCMANVNTESKVGAEDAAALWNHRFAQSELAAIDPGTEKILRGLLDRIYKMNLMAIPALRVTEQDSDSNDPLVAWMSDVRKVLYGGTKPEPDIARLT